MGDRAYAQVLCRAKDVAAFEELGFGDQEYWKGLPAGVSFLVDEEANYGNSSSLRELAERGYPFIAQDDAGEQADGNEMYLVVEPESAGYVVLGPTLRLLEVVHPRLPLTFFNLFTHALNRWVRVYDYRDAAERVEQLREWYEGDPEGETVE